MQFRERTTRAGLLTVEQLDQIDKEVDMLIENAVNKAKSDPSPPRRTC